MEQFDHKHIIRFYGVCSSQPVWIVMELAEMGEVSILPLNSKAVLKAFFIKNYMVRFKTGLLKQPCI